MMDKIDEEVFSLATYRQQIYRAEVERYDGMNWWAKFKWRLNNDIGTFRRIAASDTVSHARAIATNDGYRRLLALNQAAHRSIHERRPV